MALAGAPADITESLGMYFFVSKFGRTLESLTVEYVNSKIRDSCMAAAKEEVEVVVLKVGQI